MRHNVLVSIIIATYNHAEYLRDSIDSILNQTYDNIELIVIDDGSTDDTRDILSSYGDRFYWESQANLGQAEALNNGWKKAKGSILGYLSSDDTLHQGAVEASLRAFSGNKGCVATYCNFNLIDSDSNYIKKIVAPNYSYNNMIANVLCIPGPGAFFKKNAFLRVGMWSVRYKISPDLDFWIRLGLHGNFIHINKTFAFYRVHDNSKTFSKMSFSESLEIVYIMQSFFKINKLPSHILNLKRRSISNAYLIACQLNLRAGRYKKAFSLLIISLKLFFNFNQFIKILRVLVNGFLSRLTYKVFFFYRNLIYK